MVERRAEGKEEAVRGQLSICRSCGSSAGCFSGNHSVKTQMYCFWAAGILLSGKEKINENHKAGHLCKGPNVEFVYEEENPWVKLKGRKYEKATGLKPDSNYRRPGWPCGSFSGGKLSHFSNWRYLTEESDLCRKTQCPLKKNRTHLRIKDRMAAQRSISMQRRPALVQDRTYASIRLPLLASQAEFQCRTSGNTVIFIMHHFSWKERTQWSSWKDSVTRYSWWWEKFRVLCNLSPLGHSGRHSGYAIFEQKIKNKSITERNLFLNSFSAYLAQAQRNIRKSQRD